jgi:hypothetical protein
MGTCHSGGVEVLVGDKVVVSEAAISTCVRLLAAMRGRIRTHPYRDGGLICEDRTSRARPRMWRIAPDGALLADSSYNFARRAFVSSQLPQGVAS